MEQAKIDEAFAELAAGNILDASLSNGALRSSKDVYQNDDGTYCILHNIDGTVACFTKEALTEVFQGKRSPWEGDLESEQEDEDEEDDEDKDK